MKRRRLPFAVVLIVLLAAFAAAAWRTSARTAVLQAELHERRARQEEGENALREREEQVKAAARVSAERENKAATAPLIAEAEQLAQELGRLRAQVESRQRATWTPVRPAPPDQNNIWANAGRSDPMSTFQSVQWAIYAGEVEALEKMIALDADAQKAAEGFFASLDAETQTEYGSPHRLVAAVMASQSRSDVRSAELVNEERSGSEGTSVRLRLADARNSSREVTLRFQRGGDGWQLEVPAKIVTSYRNLLLGPAPQSEAGGDR